MGEKDLMVQLDQLNSNDVHASSQAIKSLSAKGQSALPILRNKIQTNDKEDVIAMALVVIGEIGSLAAEAIPEAIAKLNHHNEQIRMAAALSLVRIGNQSIPALLDFVREPHTQVALFWASWALTLIEPSKASEETDGILIKTEQNTDSLIERLAAQEALAKRIGKNLTKS
ncbi:HEAT repeat domain-containing protein [Shouchella patagoniensis]|uniref:HEAT repeat domain-containing protein n=1 Tax=Shouchella patagoniensis TaxID=228576 RepID=UPI000995C03A|nr:HEAT repeat domain-containing protein [Shouchella patagoniensis]